MNVKLMKWHVVEISSSSKDQLKKWQADEMGEFDEKAH